jgi:NADH-quinone oxidoreductase subunit J
MVLIVAAIASVTLRHQVHCALCLVGAFAALAALYLQLGAQFVGFAQILVYVGAVAILIVFAILLTRGGDGLEISVFSSSWGAGLAVAFVVFATLAGVILWQPWTGVAPGPAASVAAASSVKNIGLKMMTDFILPLEVLGVLLTASLIGAVILAMDDRKGSR